MPKRPVTETRSWEKPPNKKFFGSFRTQIIKSIEGGKLSPHEFCAAAVKVFNKGKKIDPVVKRDFATAGEVKARAGLQITVHLLLEHGDEEKAITQMEGHGFSHKGAFPINDFILYAKDIIAEAKGEQPPE